MKQKLMTITMALSMMFAMNATIAAKVSKNGGAPTADTTVVAESGSVDGSTTAADEVEAFSDTTNVDTGAVVAGTPSVNDWDDWDDWEDADTGVFLKNMGINGGTISGMLFVLCLMLILFVLAPVAVIALILYFIYKNRKERLRIAELAMKSGNQIPLDALGSPVGSNDALWNKGIKQIFVGAGLAILLWIPFSRLGLAIGALIMLIGCGNLVIARNAREKQRQKDLYDRMMNV